MKTTNLLKLLTLSLATLGLTLVPLSSSVFARDLETSLSQTKSAEEVGKDTGEWVDEAADDTGDAVEDGVEATGAAAEDTGEWVDEAADDTGNWLDRAVEDTGNWIEDKTD